MKYFIILLIALSAINATPVRRTSVQSILMSGKAHVVEFFGSQAASFGGCLKTKGLAEGQALAKEMMGGIAASIAAKFGMRRLGFFGGAAAWVKGKACGALSGAATTACNSAATKALGMAACPATGKMAKACTSSWANVIKPCVAAEIPAVCTKIVAKVCPSRRRLSVQSILMSGKAHVVEFFGSQAASFGGCLKTKGLAEGQALAKEMMGGIAASIAAKFGMRRLGFFGGAAAWVKGKACGALSGAATTACNSAATKALGMAACPATGKMAKACTSSWANVIKPCVAAEIPAVCTKIVKKVCPSRRRLSVQSILMSAKAHVTEFFGTQVESFGNCLKSKALAEGKALAKELMAGVAASIAAKFGMRRLNFFGDAAAWVKGKACGALVGPATDACKNVATQALNAAACPATGKLAKACTSGWANVIKPCVAAEIPAVCSKIVAKVCPSRRRLSVQSILMSAKAHVTEFFGTQVESFGNCLKSKALAEGKALAKELMTGVAKSIAAKFGMRRLGFFGGAAAWVKGKACGALAGAATTACNAAATKALGAAACPATGKLAKACTSSWANVIKPCVAAEIPAVCTKIVKKVCPSRM